MEYKFNDDEMNELKEAFRCLIALSQAGSSDNHSTCGSYHIKPFNTRWDKETVEGVKYGVNLYINTWVIPTFSRLLKLSEHDEIMKMIANWHELEARKINFILKEKKEK